MDIFLKTLLRFFSKFVYLLFAIRGSFNFVSISSLIILSTLIISILLCSILAILAQGRFHRNVVFSGSWGNLSKAERGKFPLAISQVCLVAVASHTLKAPK